MRTKSCLALLVLILALPVGAASFPRTLDRAETASLQEHLPFGLPSDSELLFRKGFIVSHNNWLKIPNWAAYHIATSTLRGYAGREDDFRPDRDLQAWQRSELADYARSGYARGHMAPSAAIRRSREANSESFLLSNMVPQIGPGFNSGIWAYLEDKVRDWAISRGEGWVFVGPIFQDTDNDGQMQFKLLGKSRVAVPSHNFMILVTKDRQGILDTIAFMLPNSKAKKELLPTFIVDIKEVERLTGLDFLADLDDDKEDELETKRPSTLWAQ